MLGDSVAPAMAAAPAPRYAPADGTGGAMAAAPAARYAPADGTGGATTAFARRAMGSPLRLTVTGVPAARSAAGWAAVSAVVESIEEALSRFRHTSELMDLNRHAGDPAGVPVGRWLGAALSAADRAHRLTGGAFDPRILSDLERLGYLGASDPSAAGAGDGRPTLESAATPAGLVSKLEPDVAPMPIAATSGGRPTFADGRWLHNDSRRRWAAVATPIDLGGIGKGLALRWAMAVLGSTLPELATDGAGALLEAGGDIVARGSAPQGGPWMIGIEHPGGGEEPAVVALRDGAICTSSIALHRWRDRDGREVHHLLDPRSGEPGGEGLLAVTVAGPDPAWAEVWSKTLFLEGLRGIAARARALGLAAWWVRADGSVEMTPAARLATAWTLA